jgi:hypothetical protein
MGPAHRYPTRRRGPPPPSSSAPLTLEDLPDDLLRRIVREYSLTLPDVLRFSECCRRFHQLAQGGGVLRELKVEVISLPNPISAALAAAALHGRQEPRRYPSFDASNNTLTVVYKTGCLDWLCAWPLLRGAPPLDRVEVVVGKYYEDPPAPAPLVKAWRRLLRTLDAATSCLHVVLYENCDEESGRGLDAASTVIALGEAARLDRLHVVLEAVANPARLLAAVGRLARLRSLSFNDEYGFDIQQPYTSDRFEALSGLAGLQELTLELMYPSAPAAFAPLAALSSLTFLELHLRRWDLPFPNLPPNLQHLRLELRPDSDYEHGYGEEIDEEGTNCIRETLPAPGLIDTLGGAGAALSLRRLEVNFSFHKFYFMEAGGLARYAVRLALTPESFPCAFPALEEFSLYLGHTRKDSSCHSADLVALFEAAPGLRSAEIQHIGNLSFETMEWLDRHRPGRRLERTRGPSPGSLGTECFRIVLLSPTPERSDGVGQP